MLTRSIIRRRGVFHNAPTTYPFVKPFHDTPYDQDRHPKDISNKLTHKNTWPVWMDEGADGTGYGIGLHRSHPLSKLKGNLRRNPESIPRVLNMMMQGAWHKSGAKLYFRGGKPPNPSKHPYLTGEPDPVYGWRVTDPLVIREFNVPAVEKDKVRYKPYVALHERKIMNMGLATPKEEKAVDTVAEEKGKEKPLMKRLFFWK
ncbi:hypothetical protein STCU_01754 [Strigomonas culicis]|uniref:Uncharacterized protein n=1 Tax=Strigomonas culicis TaxID=28005 RepID=S9UNZ4_9TRYP|nr:hypothetical protein STCU_04313 [Strigomonas culicis]EPY30623.1 hypothetical protein STCU_03974 [Strigomonas culicis]EPY32042.1 hypothetical protein STCU_03006 [Strigomonas culicis]EPY34217.1 hypothetical protein STCU_01754 [Strigomonas culicis]|eukprot:EPY29945.1 hypothetical protein STCU_04313 [Strigomonas culicis]